MAITILEALENADYNLNNNGTLGLEFAKQQLHNAITLLEKGYGIYEEVEPLLEKFGAIENVPDKQ